MKCIVVNGDDLGISRGVNRGIVEAHTRGIVTSTSLMVDMPESQEGARLVRGITALSVGLHADLADSSGRPPGEHPTGTLCRAALAQQVHSFQELMGRMPTHLDSHRNIHRDPRLLPYFLELADRYRLPLREHSPVRYLPSFYGQWGGKTHIEQIDVAGLIRLLMEIPEGVTELSCHPGYQDPQLRSSYRMEREVELRSLCDPQVARFLSALRIRLVNFAEAVDILGDPASQRGPAWPPS
jgi:chitin disaccharide deacetylase